jgi:hypothetical protein
MRIRRHLQLLVVVTVAWLLFWMAGLPDYYRQYPTTLMIVFDGVVLPPFGWVTWRSIRKSKHAIPSSLWLAFYITVPLFVYDFLYCGYYLGYGIRFVWEYWYLTVYYIIPWLILPPMGWWIDKQRERKTP